MYIHPTTALLEDTNPTAKRVKIIKYKFPQIIKIVYRIVLARHVKIKKFLLPNLSAYFGAQYMQHHPMKNAEAINPTFHPGSHYKSSFWCQFYSVFSLSLSSFHD